MMCLSNKTWSPTRLSIIIKNAANVIKLSFHIHGGVAPSDRMGKWNNNNHLCPILNVDGSCIGTSI